MQKLRSEAMQLAAKDKSHQIQTVSRDLMVDFIGCYLLRMIFNIN